jgi:hypothetical protein
MARRIGRLSTLTVAALAKAGGGRHADGGGLYPDTKGGRASWVFCYRIDGSIPRW